MDARQQTANVDEVNGEVCDVLFYQGNGSSQTQVLNYIGDRQIVATTGELMWSTGRNAFAPLNVIYRVHIGVEIADVNLHPFDSYAAFFNPIKIVSAGLTWAINCFAGYQFYAPQPTIESVKFHTPIFSQVSIGQETDMQSHRKKYDSWVEKKDKTAGLILWGVSRGTAATFCAYAKEHYPPVRLVVLEGAIDSVSEVLPRRVANVFKSEYMTRQVTAALNLGFRFFNRWNLIQYSPDGPSPLKSVGNFPEGTPVVFITSKTDAVVPCVNTERIAQALANQGKNEVFLLKLERSSHPRYMYDNQEDRDNYEAFIHAIYKKYNLQHHPFLAEKGDSLVRNSLVVKQVLSPTVGLKK
ncbi:MAG: hypothetical protein H0W64_05070 [Gammaproteobacteria bacterium]|nr:hypothetical protein [Gammaproteobacteria bacterium]